MEQMGSVSFCSKLFPEKKDLCPCLFFQGVGAMVLSGIPILSIALIRRYIFHISLSKINKAIYLVIFFTATILMFATIHLIRKLCYRGKFNKDHRCEEEDFSIDIDEVFLGEIEEVDKEKHILQLCGKDFFLYGPARHIVEFCCPWNFARSCKAAMVLADEVVIRPQLDDLMNYVEDPLKGEINRVLEAEGILRGAFRRLLAVGHIIREYERIRGNSKNILNGNLYEYLDTSIKHPIKVDWNEDNYLIREDMNLFLEKMQKLTCYNLAIEISHCEDFQTIAVEFLTSHQLYPRGKLLPPIDEENFLDLNHLRFYNMQSFPEDLSRIPSSVKNLYFRFSVNEDTRLDKPVNLNHSFENIVSFCIYIYSQQGNLILTKSFLQSLFEVFPSLGGVCLGQGSYYTREGEWIDTNLGRFIEIEDDISTILETEDSDDDMQT